MLSSWCWHTEFHLGHLHLAHIPARTAALGVNAVELNDFMLAPPRFSRVRRPLARLAGLPPAWWRYSAANLRHVAQAAQAAGVAVRVWTMDTDLTGAGWPWLAHWLYCHRGLGAARTLGATAVRVTVGGHAHQPAHLNARVAARLAALAQTAAPLKVAVENHWGLSTDPARLIALVRQANQPNLGVCFDPGNLPPAHIPGAWGALSAAANHAHFKTHHFEANGHETTLPYHTHWALCAAYTGPWSVEYEGPASPPETGIRASLRLAESLMRTAPALYKPYA